MSEKKTITIDFTETGVTISKTQNITHIELIGVAHLIRTKSTVAMLQASADEQKQDEADTSNHNMD